MTTKCDAQSVVRRLHQVGYSLEQTDQTPKLTQLMKDSITLIEQMHADVKALAEALGTMVLRIEHYSAHPDDRPNIEQWEYTEGSSDMAKARAALARIQGEAG